MSEFRFLLSGHDTVEACYYLHHGPGCALSFQEIALCKEQLRQSKRKTVKEIDFGSESFLLRPYGSRNGFPFVMENTDLVVEFGEFNNPSFRVKFTSRALWEYGVSTLHQRFMAWAESMGFYAVLPESLSRVDFTFDYWLPQIGFDERHVVSLARKDNKYRDDSQLKGLVYGKGDVVLRVYDKVLEIGEQSGKYWFEQLWGISENVWRIEWQARQEPLRRFGIRSVQDLLELQGDLLRYLATEHDTLREESRDGNRSRWPLHPLWKDLIERILTMDSQGVHRVIDDKSALNERLMRMAVSLYGYLKRIAAIKAVRANADGLGFDRALRELNWLLEQVHDPLTWGQDVDTRVQEIRFGQW